MALARKAAGVPNAGRDSDRLGRIAQPQVVLDDVSHLSPVSFVPRYTIFARETGAAGEKATLEIDPAARPYLIESTFFGTQFVELIADAASLVATSPPSNFAEFNPAPTEAPSTLTFRSGSTITALTGPIFETNAWVPLNMMVEPGTRITLQTNPSAGTTDWLLVIQEFPGGV